MEIGNKLRFLRESKGYSRETFANLLEMSASTIGRLENGERSPTFDELEILSKKLNVDLSYFTGVGTTIMMNNAQHSQILVYGNVVLVDKEIIDTLSKSLDLLKGLIDKNH